MKTININGKHLNEGCCPLDIMEEYTNEEPLSVKVSREIFLEWVATLNIDLIKTKMTPEVAHVVKIYAHLQTKDTKEVYVGAKEVGGKLYDSLVDFTQSKEDIKKKVKTVGDAIDVLGESDFDVTMLELVSSIPSSKEADCLFSYLKLVVFIKALNQGWEYKQGETFTQINRTYGKGLELRINNMYVDCPTKLLFKDKELAMHAIENVPHLIETVFGYEN